MPTLAMFGDEPGSLPVNGRMNQRFQRGHSSGLPSTAAASASRSTAPFRVVRGSAPRSGRPARRHGPEAPAPTHRHRTQGCHARANICATVDFPIPMEPVSAMLFMRSAVPEFGIKGARRFGTKETGEPRAACSISMVRPSMVRIPSLRAWRIIPVSSGS
jgi:hypothetical protein